MLRRARHRVVHRSSVAAAQVSRWLRVDAADITARWRLPLYRTHTRI